MPLSQSPTWSDPRPEFAFIDWVAQRCIDRPEVVLGIGDDAAILKGTSNIEWVTTVDVLTSGVHFTPDTSPQLIGRKAMCVNLSDIGAMGATPCAAFVGIVLPRSWERDQVEELYDGIFEQAQLWNVEIAGGDTNSWDGPLVISITLTGTVESGRAIRRDGAKAGDWIFVTGNLGGSFPSQRHLTFTPRIREAAALKNAVNLHAMLDVSDGITSDLFHILNRSGVGAILNGNAIPIHEDLPASLEASERLRHALTDGEDFELLFTVSAEDGQRLLDQSPIEIPLTKIGEITAEQTASIMRNDKIYPLNRSGWSHQFGTSSHSS
ncbi:thiamine-phosphate kinase [Planctomicrobium sp. SH668]|uniref:thiamine-phosphate kinase n=1 Tax=Planctomicrobium sp. SH668 TaxID=3448126 RepID=UPI003F5BF622